MPGQGLELVETMIGKWTEMWERSMTTKLRNPFLTLFCTNSNGDLPCHVQTENEQWITPLKHVWRELCHQRSRFVSIHYEKKYMWGGGGLDFCIILSIKIPYVKILDSANKIQLISSIYLQNFKHLSMKITNYRKKYTKMFWI